MSETARYRHLTAKYCWIPSDGIGIKMPGCGVDLASQGDPVVSWAWQLDLPPAEFAFYNDNHEPRGPIQLRADATQHRASEPETLDFVYASHLLEDVLEEDWDRVLSLWASMLKPGGHLILLVPERTLWAEAIAAGQTPNCSHKYEPFVGDMSRHALAIGLEVIEERLTECHPGDYTILGVFRKALK